MGASGCQSVDHWQLISVRQWSADWHLRLANGQPIGTRGPLAPIGTCWPQVVSVWWRPNTVVTNREDPKKILPKSWKKQFCKNRFWKKSVLKNRFWKKTVLNNRFWKKTVLKNRFWKKSFWKNRFGKKIDFGKSMLEKSSILENRFWKKIDFGKSILEKKTILENRCWKKIDFGKTD